MVGLTMVGFFLDPVTMVGFWDFWDQFVRIFEIFWNNGGIDNGGIFPGPCDNGGILG